MVMVVYYLLRACENWFVHCLLNRILFLLFLLGFFFSFFLKIFELGLFGYLFIGVIGVMGSESNLVWCI